MSEELFYLNELTRRLIKAVRLMDGTPETIANIAEDLLPIVKETEKYSYEGTIAQGSLKNDKNPIERRHSSPENFFPYSPAVGPLNPIAPPLKAEIFDGVKYKEVRATGLLDGAYVGPPNMVQGGVIALLFDDIMGTVLVANDCGAMTGTLKVRYEAPTPIGVELLWVGKVDYFEGKKVFVKGELWVGDLLTASAEGIFIKVEMLQ